SRRRHTRFSRDWSSDVCSSDLSPQTSSAPEVDLCQYKPVSLHSALPRPSRRTKRASLDGRWPGQPTLYLFPTLPADLGQQNKRWIVRAGDDEYPGKKNDAQRDSLDSKIR